MVAQTRMTARRDGAGGFVIAEVLVAVVLMAALIVPLATGMTSAVGRAASVREQAERLPAMSSDSATRAAWEWGPMVAGLRWTSGPTATIELETPADLEVAVGLWVDGWFLGERSSGGNHLLEIAAESWSGLAGRELTARVRLLDGGWGPPWRSLIPGERFEPVPIVDLGRDAAASDGATTGTETVVHVPGLANPDIGILRTDAELRVDRLGLVFHLLPPTTGVSEIHLGGFVQSWRTEDGRALDLYF